MLAEVDHAIIINLRNHPNTDLHKEVDQKDLQLQMLMELYQLEENQRAIQAITVAVDKEVQIENYLD